MSKLSRRAFLPLSFVAASSILNSQRNGLPTLEDVRLQETDFYKYLEMDRRGENGGGDIRYWVGAVIRSGKPEAVEMLRKSLREHKSIIDQRQLDSGLIQSVDPHGEIGPTDFMVPPYQDKKIQNATAKVLIEAGADATYHKSYSPAPNPGALYIVGSEQDNLNLVHEAASEGNLDLVKLLAENGADAKAVAVYYWFPEKTKDGKPVLDPYGGKTFDQTVPMIPYAYRSTVDAAVNSGNPEVVTYLASKGALPAAKSDPPVLVDAALHGEPAMVKALLAIGVPRDVRDSRGHTAEDYLRSDGPPLPLRREELRSEDAIRSEYWYIGYDERAQQSRYKYPSVAAFKNSKSREILAMVGTPGRPPAPPLARSPTDRRRSGLLRESGNRDVRYWLGKVNNPVLRFNAYKTLSRLCFLAEGNPPGAVALFEEAAKGGNRQAIRDLKWLADHQRGLDRQGYTLD